jgi:hypothetical protein
MSPKFLKIHNECVVLSRRFLKAESALVAQLQLVAKFDIHKKVGKRSLFLYATDVCGLSEARAYAFTSLARKSNEHPELESAIKSESLSISKASRLVSVICKSNAGSLVEFAKNHNFREIDREVRRINPKAAEPQRISPLAETVDLLHCPINTETSELIKRAQAIVSQNKRAHQDLAQTIHQIFEDWINQHDPMKKAERRKARQLKKVTVATVKEPENSVRTEKANNERLSAAEVHEVNLRDCRKCRQLLENGKRCNEDRWIDYHHIIERKNGGTNHPDNLITLCRFHHDLIHRHEMELRPSPISDRPPDHCKV